MDISFFHGDDNLRIVQKTYFPKSGAHGCDISGPFWMLIQSSYDSGRLSWRVDSEEVSIETRTPWIYLPPYTWAIEEYEKVVQIEIRGIIGSGDIPKDAPGVASLFESPSSFPTSRSELDHLFSTCKNQKEISLCPQPGPLALRIKRLLDKNFRKGITMAQIAQELGTSSAVCSREFKKSFGFTAGFYKKGLKVTAGTYSLVLGATPIEAAVAAGYNDLSRFYKQFRQYMKMTPDTHRFKSKNAKT